jgi:hypothetical protein
VLIVSAPYLYQTLGFSVWERAKDDRIHDAKDSCIGANAKGERKHSYQCKSRAGAQHSPAVTKVLP